MDKNYDHKKHEEQIYQMWEPYFAPVDAGASQGKKPFCIIMPPPNANGELHLGHTTFIAVSDALIRYHRMKGESVLWLPGIDHAGILTQVTFEKKLKKEESKTRHDLGREEFHRRVYEFCMQCKSAMENQMRALGCSCDWSREKFTLDPEISQLVLATFVRMHKEGLVYRGYRIVNWCPRCRSTLSNLELEWQERKDPLYFIKYGPFTLATVRPETKFGDTAIAVHPDDKRYSEYVGQEIEAEGLLGKFKLKVISDEAVDKDFGTGVIKVTPGHDPLDWEIGQRHNLEVKTVIDFDGCLTGLAGPYQSMKVAQARERVVADLQAKGLIEKIDTDYTHSVATCERCGTVIEPLVSRQWFVKISSLAKPAMEAVRKGQVKIIPKKYEKMYFNWMGNIKDWPISRQLWWGHQLPAWYKKEDQKTAEQLREFELLKKGDTRARTDVLDSPIVSIAKPVEPGEFIQDPDTFDAWFSSGQWPVNTLKTSGPNDFEHFYPTTLMNTAYEILFLWVARMVMFGLYLTGKVPFEVALINGVLRDEKGQKMSKSKGNGINPNEAIDKYGADAVRFALIAGRDSGNDLLISKSQMELRIKGYRNFSNKIWNAARFVSEFKIANSQATTSIKPELIKIVASITKYLNQMRLGEAAETIYDKFWHWYCDLVIEQAKQGQVSKEELQHGLEVFLKLLHPFMPFVTETVWQELKLDKQLLIVQHWPSA